MTNSVKWDLHRTPDEYNEDGVTQKAILTIILSDGTPITVPTTSHHYKAVLKAITDAELNGQPIDESAIRQMTSISFIENIQLRNLSPRVQFDGKDQILFDGDPVEGAIGDHIRELAKANKPVDALANFLDKLSQNPSENSRKQFYNFVTKHGLTITNEGDVIAYKGVKIGDDGTPLSIRSGPGIVDGVTFTNAHLPNYVGATVTIPRSYVNSDEFVGCAAGLHVGTFEYAQWWGQGMTLTVKFNPRDVVSVPVDSAYQKVRVARYEVIDTAEIKWKGPLYGSESTEDSWGDEDDWYEGEDLSEWIENGIDRQDAIDYIDEGFSLDEAITDNVDKAFESLRRTDSENEDIEDWILAGFSEEDAEMLIDDGWNLTNALAEQEVERAKGKVWPPAAKKDEPLFHISGGEGKTLPAEADKGFASKVAPEETEKVESEEIEGQIAIDFTVLNVRATQDALIDSESADVKVSRLKTKENEDGTLRRATLILKGDKPKKRIHLYFKEDGTFDRKVVDAG